MSEPGLDHAFLEYIGYDSAAQRAHQASYLPLFAGCRHVIDLGCGHGDMVALLREAGIDALGVDADPDAVAHMRARGLPVVEGDAFAYLVGLPDGSTDGVIAAHLVEHLPFERVLDLCRAAARVLRPGGVLLVTTPDPRSLYAHLEMFYLHFGHVSFYHPRLLAFFLEQAGFEGIEWGSADSPIVGPPPLFGGVQLNRIAPRLPVWGGGPLRRLLRWLRMGVAHLFLRPYLDRIQNNFEQLDLALRAIDRPFECWVKGVKP